MMRLKIFSEGLMLYPSFRAHKMELTHMLEQVEHNSQEDKSKE